MFKLLFTTAPLLAPFVLAAPVQDDITPADLQNTVSLPVATSVAQDVSPESPLNHEESDAVRSSHFNPVVFSLQERDETSPTSLIDADNTITITSSTDVVSDESDNDSSDTTLDELDTRAVGKRNVLYFTNWGIYGANYQPQQIPADQVTHLLYSFADIASDGTVKGSDDNADIQKHYSGDSWNEAGNNAYGCVKQMYKLKKKYRKFKTILSIGGWTWSYKFAPVAATAAGRKKFANSAVKLMIDWGMDGIDIDWEYPTNAQEANNYVALLKEVRTALDNYSSTNKLNYRFIITVATPAGPSHYKVMNLKGMNPYVDAWHLMAYDYAGSWDSTTGHQSNIYLSKTNPLSTKFSTDAAVNDYIKAGVPASKIVLGLPLYGRSFAGTAGLGKPYSGKGGGTLEAGIYLFRDLPRPGSKLYTDRTIGTSCTYDASKRELVTFDSLPSANLKADYIQKRSLAGAVYWEASGDKTGRSSIVRQVANRMGTLDSANNLLSYPKSVYDNIRKNMP